MGCLPSQSNEFTFTYVYGNVEESTLFRIPAIIFPLLQIKISFNTFAETGNADNKTRIESITLVKKREIE